MGGDERWYGAADKIVEAIREAEYMSVAVALVAATRHAIARVLAEVAVPPAGHVRLPDGRDVAISDGEMAELTAAADSDRQLADQWDDAKRTQNGGTNGQ